MVSRASATGDKSNRRRREAPTRAYLDVSNWPRWLVLIVDDVVTKNERHRAVTIHGSKAKGTKSRASVIESAVADAFKEAVRDAALAAAERGFAGTASGAWSLELLSVWPTQRHLPDGLDVPFGDSDSPLSLVRDALQHAGVVDNDIRIVADRAVHHYCKGVRRIVARLRPSTLDDLRLRDDLLAAEKSATEDRISIPEYVLWERVHLHNDVDALRRLYAMYGVTRVPPVTDIEKAAMETMRLNEPPRTRFIVV